MISIGRVISTALQFIDGFTKPSKEVIKNMQKMANNMSRNAKEIQKAGKVISDVGSAMTKAITLPIAGVATAALKMSNDFENAMAKVGTIADTTNTPMTALKEQVIDLSNAVGVGVTDIAEAQYQAISAGVDTAASVDFVSTAVKAAKGGFTDTTTAVDGLTTVLNAYGFEAGKAAEISDQMLLAQNFGKTSFGDMASSMGKVIPIASSLNVSTEELFGSIAVLTKNGIATSEAVTGLKAAYSNILKPSADASKTAQQLGLDFSSAHLQSVGWAKFLDEIKEKTGGNTETMAKLFGSTEALNSVTVLAGKGSADFTKVLGQMGEAAGMTQTAYEKMLTPTERMNISFNKIKNSLIQFGEALTPVFDKVAEIIGKVGDKLNNLSEGQVNAIVKFAAIAAAIGPVVLVFGKVVTKVGTAQRIFGTITKTIADFGGIMGVITSPAGIVIGILAAIALAAFFIIKNWDQVKGFLQGVGNWFKNAFEKAGFSVEGFKNKFQSITDTVGSIAGKISGFCKSVASIFKKEFAGDIKAGATEAGGVLEMLAGAAAAAFDGIVTVIDKGLQAFDALLRFFAGAFADNWDNAAQGFRNSLKNIFPPNIAEGLTKAFDTVLPVIKAAVSGVKEMFSGLVQDTKKIFGGITEIFKGIGTMLKGIFSGDIKTVLKGFKTAAGGIVDTIGSIFKANLNAIKNFVVGALSTFLPESTVKKIAGAFDVVARAWDIAINAAKGCIDGYVQAVEPLIEDIKTVFKGVAQFVKGAFSGDWKGALNGLKTVAGGVLSGLVNIIKAPFKMIANAVKGALDPLKNTIKNIFGGIGNTIKNAMSKSGVDMGKFGDTVKNVRTRVGSIINGLKTIFTVASGTIGKVVKAVSIVIAKIFGIEISAKCSVAKAAMIAFKAVAGAVFTAIADKIKKVMNIIVPVVKVAFNAISGAISAAVNTISSIIDGVMTVFDGLITFISGVFTGNWRQAWEGVGDIFKGIFETSAAICKAPMNAIIGIINGAINGINKLGLTIPEWVPGIGGQSFKINVPTIPMLYKGTDNWRGGAAVIHDRGGEIVDLPKGSRVYPHDKSLEMARREGARSSQGSVSIVIQKLADKIEVRSDEDIDRIAEALAYKLKKVAFNTGTV